jgi:K+-transporting ATPase ATPase C chain
MKNLMKSIKITLMFCIMLTVTYIFVLWIFARIVSSKKGDADVITLNGKVVGAANVGQNFTKDIYFWSRPSAAGNGYDAASSAGSNKGPTNEKYLQTVKTRIDSFLVHHPYLHRNEVPAEMVTASGSGLDPDITPECAYVQIKRIAHARKMNEAKIKAIVDRTTEKPLLAILGPSKVNVLKLNVALEEENNK